MESKADTVPIMSESAAAPTTSLQTGPQQGAVTQHRGSNVEVASSEEIAELERKMAVEEVDEDEEQGIGDEEKLRDATVVVDEAAGLPGRKTQEQPAASAEDAGTSVAD